MNNNVRSLGSFFSLSFVPTIFHELTLRHDDSDPSMSGLTLYYRCTITLHYCQQFINICSMVYESSIAMFRRLLHCKLQCLLCTQCMRMAEMIITIMITTLVHTAITNYITSLDALDTVNWSISLYVHILALHFTGMFGGGHLDLLWFPIAQMWVGVHRFVPDKVYATFLTVFQQWLSNSQIWWPWTRPWIE